MNILVVYHSKENTGSLMRLAKVKTKLLEYIKDDKFKLLEKSNMLISVENMDYHFFDLATRNVKNFIQKGQQFDYVYFNYQVDTQVTEAFLSLVSDRDKLIVAPSLQGYHLYEHYKETFDKIEVYQLSWDKKKSETITIRSYEFKPKEHFRTKQEAQSKIKEISAEQIEFYKSQIETYTRKLKQEEIFFKKL